MKMICAVDEKWGIGRDGSLLVRIPEDMKFFREKTLGKAIIMGRKTLESLPGARPLDGRNNIVLTSNMSFHCDGTIIVHNEEEMKEAIKGLGEDSILIGGASIYNAYYKDCEEIFVTKIQADLLADTFITDISADPDFVLSAESSELKYGDLIYTHQTFSHV